MKMQMLMTQNHDPEPETTPTSHEPLLIEDKPLRLKLKDADHGTTQLVHVCRHCSALYFPHGDNNFCHIRHKTMAEAVDEAYRRDLRWLAERNLDDA